MKPTRLFSAFLLTAVAAIATPTTATGHLGHLPIFNRAEGPVVPFSYIIVLKSNTDLTAHLSLLSVTIDSLKQIRYKYPGVNGYNAILDDASLNQLQNDPSVAYIEPDYLADISYTISPFQSATPPVRHRSRASLMCSLFGMCPSTPGKNDGTGVDIYGLDTGIYIENQDFGTRAIHGPAFGPYNSSDDGNGHGTHTASTAAGAQYGIATGASLIGVKVLSDAGSGAYSDIMAGINWVVQQAKITGRPSVINCSLGGPASQSLNDAVKSAVNSGVHFVAAAGNSAIDAGTQSPAGEPSIVTVGAVDRTNKMASFSNFGPVLDVFALGVNVKAAYIGNPQATAILSGTSMASPAVAGTLAVELSKYGKASPADLQNSLKKNARAVVTGQPTNTTNLLATTW